MGYYEFEVSKFVDDLKKLYEDTEILIRFYNVRNGYESDNELIITSCVQQYSNIESLDEMPLLHKLHNFISELPKFPLELTLDELGELKILPGFESVFEAAYYALAQFVAIQPDVSAGDDSKSPLGVCKSCGKCILKMETVKSIAMTRNAKKMKPS